MDSKKSELEKKKAQLEELKKKKLQRNIQKVSTLSAKSIEIDKILNDIDQIPSELPTITINNTFNKKSIDLKTLSHKKKNLSFNKLKIIEIPPKEHISYSKESQTLSTNSIINNENVKNDTKTQLPLEFYDGPFIYDTLTWEDEFNSNSINTDLNRQQNESSSLNDNELLINFLSIPSNTNQISSSTSSTVVTTSSTQAKIDILLPEKQKEIILNDDEFCKFFREKTTIIERALKQENIYFDYSQFNNTNELFGDYTEPIKLFKEFNDEKLKNRIVTSLDWNNQNDEQFIASYETINNDFDDGLALIWNLNSNKNIPEYSLNSSSWITSICFNQFHTNLIIGATYTGQICIWDIRSNKHTPIQRTPFSISSHTSPIYCLKLVGSSNANNLISLSNDGRMCLWNTCNMNQPIETIDLHIRQSSNIPILCFDSNLQDNFIVGTEDSLIYSLNNKNTLNSKYYLNDTFEAHSAPICSLSCNKAQSDFSNLFLSSSFDWTIKLWNADEPNGLLYSFDDSNETIYDVKWSPINPSLFASCDESGKLSLWNLLHDTEVPIASIQSSPTSNNIALNKLIWSKDGHHILTGDDNGKLSLFNLSDSVARPKTDDSCKFNKVISFLKENYENSQEMQKFN